MACVWVAGAMASPHHEHKEYQTVSPFDKKQDAQSAHCILNSHTHFGFCPHSLSPKNNVGEFWIATDCGGKTPGTVPTNLSISKNLSVIPLSSETPAFISVDNITRVLPQYSFELFDPLEHPPRFS